MVICSVALVLACVAFLVYDILTFRQQMVEDLSSQADIIGSNSTAALTFDDPESATEVLAALAIKKTIICACIINTEGDVFAEYHRKDGKPHSAHPDNMDFSHQFINGGLDIVRQIVLDNENIGKVYLRSDLDELRSRLKSYTIILTSILVASLLIALFLSSKLQKVISSPILYLAKTAKTISIGRDYTIRAQEHGDRQDEIGHLFEGFNEMLEQIEKRDASLREARAILEQRVNERTSELRETVDELELEVTERKRAEGQLEKRSNELQIAKEATEKHADELAKAFEELNLANQELKEMHGQMVQHEKLASIGQLAAGVAHEMNTPVGFVASNFETLGSYMKKINDLLKLYNQVLDKIESSEDSVLKSATASIREFQEDTHMDFIMEDIQVLFKDSEEGLDRVASIIQNLRDFSRIDQAGDFAQYNVNEGIEATLVVARNEIKYNAEVETEFGSVPPVFCNSGKINQVFLNILVNAGQAIGSQEREGRGKICIRTYATDEDVICEISDDGPGIPEENIAKIFDPFFTTKPAGKGTGLGLNVSYDIIVNKHGGVLQVESILGKGTKFIIKLPISGEKCIINNKDADQWKTEQSCL